MVFRQCCTCKLVSYTIVYSLDDYKSLFHATRISRAHIPVMGKSNSIQQLTRVGTHIQSDHGKVYDGEYHQRCYVYKL